MISEIVKHPPDSLIQKCPESLPKLQLEEETWVTLTGQEQVELIIDKVVTGWAPTYYKCAIKHNRLSDWYTENVKQTTGDVHE